METIDDDIAARIAEFIEKSSRVSPYGPTEARYKALRYNVGHGEAVSASATSSGPVIGLTGYW